ncbi:PREDICTED: olfactory receptor 52M1-like [Calidris pugnax]|uniref:olfactory receptor 52M1-like n=1 Tax=Calidris pugnax TaxID=198806 RepID=UPI00071CEA8E|nr:PREDICTED: olfactory receptor 52M1-like [Calidris pugnax]
MTKQSQIFTDDWVTRRYTYESAAVFTKALLGNNTLLYVVKKEPSLHKPMFYSLSMLAVIDSVLSLTNMAKMLSIFWRSPRRLPWLGSCCLCLFSSIMVLFIVWLDLFIGLSCLRILRTVLSLALKEDRLKVFGSCFSRICIILVFYTPVVPSPVIHRFGCHVASHMHILMANFYLPFPPTVHAIKIIKIHDLDFCWI